MEPTAGKIIPSSIAQRTTVLSPVLAIRHRGVSRRLLVLALVKLNIKLVLVIAVSGDVGGVKLAVYCAVPLRMRSEDM